MLLQVFWNNRPGGLQLDTPRARRPFGKLRTGSRDSRRDAGATKPCCRYHSTQGLTRRMPQSSKSAVLRVARTASREWAIAAIWASRSAIGRPFARRRTAISGNARAASSSNGRMRPARTLPNIRSVPASSAARRFPCCKSSIPYKISASVTVVMNSEPGCCRDHHVSTVAEGEGRIGSETTFVSKIVTPEIT